MGAPFFSIVMATYGRGPHIRPSIESAMRQTFDDFELLVVGDGCTAGAEAVVRSFPPQKTRWLALPENTGSQSAPNNLGIANASGSWIAYLGHDDIWSAAHLSELAAAAASPSVPDVVVSGCLYHGPPGTGVVCVNGLFDDDRAKFEHFFPPSSFAHRREVSTQIGGWRDPRAVAAPVDVDFLLRAANAGFRFAPTGRVTVHKFAAGHRYLSYLRQSSDEQAAMLTDPRLDDLRAWEGTVSAARRDGRFMAMGYPDYSQARTGAAFIANRSNKGLERPILRALAERTVMRQADEPRALDWYGLEGGDAPFRWSGPSPRPKILIPFTYDGMARITLHARASWTKLKDVEITRGNGRLTTKVVETAQGRALVVETALHPSWYTILEMHTATMVKPSEISEGADQRRLGIALAEISVEPLGRVASGTHLRKAWRLATKAWRRDSGSE